MRQDFFIIWPHGLKHVPNMVKTMKGEYKDQFSIRNSVRYEIKLENMETFFDTLYRTEDNNHIRAKTQHIISYVKNSSKPAHVHLIEFDNLQPNVKTFYDGISKKCANVEALKIRFRNSYNPRFPNSQTQILPLDKGVSHDHIIHSSDKGEDITHMREVFMRYTEKVKLNILKIGNYHHKNDQFLQHYINENHTLVTNIKEANVVLSADTLIDPSQYTDKKFILGPHFGKERINEVSNINTKYNNAVYIQPSQPSVDLWIKELGFTNMPVLALPFGVNTDMFKPTSDTEKTDVILYYKHRHPSDMEIVLNFLEQKGIKPRVFSYEKRYREKDYFDCLNRCKFAVWIGAHESQGFALQECL